MHGTAGGTCEQNTGDHVHRRALDCARADFKGSKARLATRERERGTSYVSWNNARQTFDAGLGTTHFESVHIVTTKLYGLGSIRVSGVLEHTIPQSGGQTRNSTAWSNTKRCTRLSNLHYT